MSDLFELRGMVVEGRDLPERFGRLAASLAHPEKAMRDFAAGKVRRIKESFVRSPKMEAAAQGQAPHAHTRGFSSSILSEVFDGGLSAQIGSVDVRAQVLQDGKTIFPKTAKALAIPLVEKAYGKRPRDFAGLHFVPVKAGKVRGFLVQETAKSKKHGFLEAGEKNILFILLASVRIRPHPWLKFEARDEDALGMALEDQMDRETGRGYT